jgi:hypothetical protein
VQGFDANKFTQDISGYMRQEFRELNLLDEMTLLRYNKSLSVAVSGQLPNPLIRSNQLWKGENYESPR